MCGETHPQDPDIVPGAQRGHRGTAQPRQSHHVEREPEWNPAFYVTSHFFKVLITFKHFEGHTNPVIGPCLATFGSRASGCQGLRDHMCSHPPSNPMWLARWGLTCLQICWPVLSSRRWFKSLHSVPSYGLDAVPGLSLVTEEEK